MIVSEHEGQIPVDTANTRITDFLHSFVDNVGPVAKGAARFFGSVLVVGSGVLLHPEPANAHGERIINPINQTTHISVSNLDNKCTPQPDNISAFGTEHVIGQTRVLPDGTQIQTLRSIDDLKGATNAGIGVPAKLNFTASIEVITKPHQPSTLFGSLRESILQEREDRYLKETEFTESALRTREKCGERVISQTGDWTVPLTPRLTPRSAFSNPGSRLSAFEHLSLSKPLHR